MGKASYIMQREDLKQALKTIDRLRAREQELEARVALLEEAAENILGALLPSRTIYMGGQYDKYEVAYQAGAKGNPVRELQSIFHESPRQSVAEIEAQALERFANRCDYLCGEVWAELARIQANRIRKQNKEQDNA